MEFPQTHCFLGKLPLGGKNGRKRTERGMGVTRPPSRACVGFLVYKEPSQTSSMTSRTEALRARARLFHSLGCGGGRLSEDGLPEPHRGESRLAWGLAQGTWVTSITSGSCEGPVEGWRALGPPAWTLSALGPTPSKPLAQLQGHSTAGAHTQPPPLPAGAPSLCPLCV